MAIHENIEELIGNTPLLELYYYNQLYAPGATIIAKLEMQNPTGSNKDRASLAMIEEAEESGKIDPDTILIEPTSGNTGIALAAIAAERGYRLILTMPETMSIERRKLLLAYGAELILTNGEEGMPGALKRADELAEEYPNSFIVGQFTNPANPAIHRATTGPEIWKQTDGNVDIFVAGVGTGGTVTGVGEYLKSVNPQAYVVAVEPASSAVLSGKSPGPHQIQGIGPGFVPKVLNTQIYDEVIAVEDEDAFSAARLVAKMDGLLVGASSGAVLWAATELANRFENESKTIVALFPDSGERYLSTALFAE